MENKELKKQFIEKLTEFSPDQLHHFLRIVDKFEDADRRLSKNEILEILGLVNFLINKRYQKNET